MYNTAYERMCCILDGYGDILKAYNKDLLISIDARYYLAKDDSYFYLKTIPESLHNLISQPAKAYQIIILLKRVLTDRNNKRKEIISLKALLRQYSSYNFQNDPDASLYAESVISRMVDLASDDKQFSEFSYF